MIRRGLGVGLTLAVILGALAAPWLAPHDPARPDFAQTLRPPGTSGHPLGTDQLGRDLLARVLHGARLALFIGACTAVVTAVAGGLLGLLTGFVEGWPSTVIMRLADVQLSFPFILLAMTINVIVGLGLSNIIVSLSAAGWVVYARVVRGEVLSVKQREFVHAAAALGAGRVRLLFRHVLPNVAPSIIVVASLLLGWGPALFGQTVMEPLFKADQTYASYGNNKLVDDKVARAVTLVDARARVAAYAELQKMVRDEAAWVPLWQQHDLYGVASHVDWTPRADEKVWMYDAKVTPR